MTLIPDSGRGYLSKLYDDNWLIEHGFLERGTPATIEEVLAFKRRQEPDVPELVTVQSHQKVGDASTSCSATASPDPGRPARRRSIPSPISSAPSASAGSSSASSAAGVARRVAAAMEPPLPAVEMSESVDTVFADLSGGNPAVVVARNGKPVGVLSRADLLEYLAHGRDGTGA